MFDEFVPNKIIVFFDKVSEGFLIRLVDKDWNDIVKYDSLPALCRISDLYVDTIDVGGVERLESTDGITKIAILINDEIVFRVFEDGTSSVGVLYHWSTDDYREDKKLCTKMLKDLFSINI